jgi:dipeptidyl aminopeptidase/acylaminoacyl peptidase
MKGVTMSRQDLLARIRPLDPDLRFDDGDSSADALAALEQVRARDRSQKPVLTIPRVAVVAGALVLVVLLLPALAVGTRSLHLLGQPTTEAPPVNGLLVAKGADGLIVLDPKSGGVLGLKGTAELSHPVWSPDGQFLAVEKAEKGGGTSVYTIWPNGTHPQLIMENASAPAWSDDGTRVFVQRDTCTTPGGCDSSDEESTVAYSVAANGTDAHQVGDDDYAMSQPGWPPGQNILAFLAQEGSRDTAGLPTSVDSSEATWSPDGTELAIADAPMGIWVANDDGVLRLVVKGAFSSLSWGTERAVRSPSTSTRPAERSARR